MPNSSPGTNSLDGHGQPPLPIGTQIVTLVPTTGSSSESTAFAGAVGVVVARSDENTYRIRFPDGGEVVLPRTHIAVRAHIQRAGLHGDLATAAQIDLYAYVIYRCVVGSRAYGLEEPGSDVDRRGIYVPPAERHWSLYGVPDQLERA
jgi:hypothetical protein